ncbi:hypothetical protein GPECTOR_45g169 [Gonium pectorale]|uniref:Uncharacterized protein n=1 Tax=Gonium pectorale TaxID=33097 RepID=A0A150G8W4_GONPE|nr:hypothetical protein GPECTOR_45g169 [Gonium pectorale]|eukprot:KXZ46299.1 hypothetical protein GPECTOR_45g169 [Gonium pectorale]
MEHAVARAYAGMMRQRRKGRRGGKGGAYVGQAEACGPVGGESGESEEGGGKGQARALQPTGIALAVAIAGSGDGGSDDSGDGSSDGGDGEENDGGDDGCAFDPYGLECGDGDGDGDGSRASVAPSADCDWVLLPDWQPRARLELNRAICGWLGLLGSEGDLELRDAGILGTSWQLDPDGFHGQLDLLLLARDPRIGEAHGSGGDGGGGGAT